MEQPPGTLDDLQPQDLSTSGLPSVIDLTGRDEECVLDPSSLTAMVQNPGWFQNSGLPFPETSTVHPSSHIQPDNAFSTTTVTLSYVSRSHVFSSNDSPNVYSVPSFSKYPLQPQCDLDKGLGEAITLNQHYSKNIEGPIDLAAQTELLPSLSQATLGQLELNGAIISNVESHLDTIAANMDTNENGQNGQVDIWESSDSLQDCSGLLQQCPKPLENSEEFLEASANSSQDNVQAFSNSLCKKSFSEFSQSLPECPKPLEEQPTPLQVSSLEFLKGHTGLLPRFSTLVPKSLREQPTSLAEGLQYLQKSPKSLEESSASLEEQSKSCLDSSQECQENPPQCLAKEVPLDTNDISDRDSPEVVFVMSTSQNKDSLTDLSSLNKEFPCPLVDPVSPATSIDGVDDVCILPEASSSSSGDNSFIESTNDGSLDGSSTQETSQPMEDSTPSSKETGKRTLLRRKAALEPLLDLTKDLGDEIKRKIPHINGNAKALQNTVNERRLPVRASRGMRLEAIVMNINSSRYNVSGCIRTGKKSPKISDSKAKLCKNDKVSEVKKSKEKKVKAKASPRKSQTSVSPENCKNATSSSQGNTPQVEPLQVSPVRLKRKSTSNQTPQSESENTQELLSKTENSLDVTAPSVTSTPEPPKSPKSPKKSPSKNQANMSAKKPSPRSKTKPKSTPQKRRKKIKGVQLSSMFSPKEPEIKLKYVNYKEEKRDSRLDCFSPFIRVERKESVPSLCTVVNYPEEIIKKNQQQQGISGQYASTVIPTSSCLQLGRLSTRGEHQRALVCCLCGHSANAMDLGDLHGPYYSEGYQPKTEKNTAGSGGKEDTSDSDSSCGVRERRGKQAGQKQWTTIKGQWRDGSGSPAAKRPRADVEDWYSAPVLPLEPCEYWLHEDCGIWSAGVFLVKGRVYGLEEAVRTAQNTTCSACREQGATLGCFFKGCPNKYHYRCALQSDCVLIEDNFSIKCKKHKNKSTKVPQNCRRDDR